MRTKQRRLDPYDPYGDFNDPEGLGLMPHDTHFDLGTPNLTRAENIIMMAADSALSKSLLLKIKWRPHSDGQTVSTISRLTFTLERDVYEFSQVETYKPQADSCLKPGRILTYGSNSSKLKLTISSPYRLARIYFNGHMQQVSGDVDRLVHVKLCSILLPVSEIFDLQSQVDESCLRQIYAEKRPKRSFGSVVSELVQHDRHEQRIRLIGELVVSDHGNQSARRQETFEIRGYHARHFLTEVELDRQVETRRLYAFANNGQGFHIGHRRHDQDSIDFGYVAFHPHPKCDFIDKPFKIDGELGAELEKFQLQVSGHTCTFDCSGERRFQDWFKLEFNGKPGWAWMSLDDELVESKPESLALEESREAFRQSLESGHVCHEEQKFDSGTEPLVVSIEDELGLLSDLVGAKASSLAKLRKFVASNEKYSEYLVPRALVLTRFAHDLIFEENPNLQSAVDELKQNLGKVESSDLRGKCKQLEDQIKATKLPERVASELWAKLEANQQLKQSDGSDDDSQSDAPSFAVRSSSWGEDEADMSAAGQLSTILNVGYDLEALSKAAMSCFASKFSSENVEYKRQHGQPVDLPMAVVVQRMISCDMAGVMFTCDPTNGDESLITITANYGLGESVVSAQADPDSIKVRAEVIKSDYSMLLSMAEDRPLRIEEVKIGKKEVVISAANSNGTDQDKSKCCLNDEQIIKLAGCGIAIKRYFWNQRRDIEWGFKRGRLHLFQSRPVTGLESWTETELLHEFDKCAAAELSYFTRANVGEVMPHAVKPLTVSLFVSSWNILGYRVISKFLGGLRFAPQVSVDFSYQKCHALFSCRNSMLLSLDESKKSTLSRSLEIGFFGREIGARPDITESARGLPRAPQPFQGFWFKLRTWQLRWMPVRTVEREMSVMHKLRHDVRARKLAIGYESNKLMGLYHQMLTCMNYAERCWSNHIVIIIMGTYCNMILSSILSKYIKDPTQLCAATNRFLALSRDVVSAEIPERVAKIAKLISDLGSVELQKFTELTAAEALEYIMSETEPSRQPLRSAFVEFLVKFGHRCYNEFEMAENPWRETPSKVVEMVQRNCSALASKKVHEGDDKRDKTFDDVIKSLNIANLTLKDKLVLKHMLVPRSQLMLSTREKTKNILILFSDIVRESSRMLAAEMVRSQRIPDEDLFYYLSVNELRPLIVDHQPTIVMRALRRRQLFKKMFSVVWKFDEIFTDVVPNHLKPTKELEEAIAQAPKLFGTPASSGKVRGQICRVEDYTDLDKVRPGTILLTYSTDIAFSPIFPMISGIITEVGGLVSHGAVVAREYGLPSLIGIPDVMRILQDEEEIILDADNGTIVRLSKSSAVEGSDQ